MEVGVRLNRDTLFCGLDVLGASEYVGGGTYFLGKILSVHKIM